MSKLPPRTCTVDDCQRRTKAKGFCALHYKRWRKSGDPNRGLPTVRERFLSFCPHRPVGDCWEWTGSRDRKGYGRLNVNKVPQVASRVAYELFVGPIAPELYVCHTCDNPACVNPEHLFLGAPLDNTNDMIAKERNVRGEQSPNAKLTDKLVRRGRLFRAQGMSYVAIGERLGVSESVARRAVKGQTWAHVD